jgi:hypothetical protein
MRTVLRTMIVFAHDSFLPDTLEDAAEIVVDEIVVADEIV